MGDTGLRHGEVQGEEVQPCCSLRGFSENPTPSGSNIQLGKTLSLAPGGEKLQGRRF